MAILGTNGAAPFVPTFVLSKKVGTLVSAHFFISQTIHYFLKKQINFISSIKK